MKPDSNSHIVLGNAEVGAFENRQLKYSTKADRSTNVDVLPSAPILAIPCYAVVLILLNFNGNGSYQ